MHAKLRQKAGLKEQLLHMDDLASHLPPRIQYLFKKLPIHKEILSDLNKLNAAFLPIVDYMVCYKSEIGLCLQQLIESFNILLLNQF
jgi:hypothetical protein